MFWLYFEKFSMKTVLEVIKSVMVLSSEKIYEHMLRFRGALCTVHIQFRYLVGQYI